MHKTRLHQGNFSVLGSAQAGKSSIHSLLLQEQLAAAGAQVTVVDVGSSADRLISLLRATPDAPLYGEIRNTKLPG